MIRCTMLGGSPSETSHVAYECRRSWNRNRSGRPARRIAGFHTRDRKLVRPTGPPTELVKTSSGEGRAAPSAASSSSWCRVQREASLGLGALVVPAEVAGDRGFPGGVAGVAAAVEGEVAQRGELGLDPVQPGGVRGVDTSSTWLAAHQSVVQSFLCGEKLSHT